MLVEKGSKEDAHIGALRFLMHELNTPEFVAQEDHVNAMYIEIAEIMDKYADQKQKDARQKGL